MKKKIALLANGWSNEIVTDAVEGIRKTLYEKNADLFMFTSHAIFGAAPEEIAAENAVFDLPYMEDFDGAIVFSNILNAEYPLIKEISDKILSKNIPVISIGADVEGAGYVKLDNESGMRDLTKHLYDECKV